MQIRIQFILKQRFKDLLLRQSLKKAGNQCWAPRHFPEKALEELQIWLGISRRFSRGADQRRFRA